MPEIDDRRAGPWLLAGRTDSITRLYGQINYLQAVLRLEMNEFVRETVPGHVKFCGDQLALLLRESPATMDRLVTDAQIFAEYPTIVAQVAEGLWTIRHADALLDEIVGSSLDHDQREQVAQLVAGRKGVRTPYEIKRAARAAVLVIDPEAAERRYEKIRDDRSVSSSENPDGSATAWINGPKHIIAEMNACLDTMCTSRQPGDTRSLTQRRFDTLRDLVCGRATPGQWTAYVMVRLEALESLVDGTPADAGIGGEIPGLGLMTMTEAQEVLGQASWRRAVVDEHGQLVSLDPVLHSPDLEPEAPVRLVSDALEPAEEPAPEDDGEPTLAERQWAFVRTELDAHVMDLTSSLEQELTALLASQPALAFAGQVHPAPGRLVFEFHRAPHTGGGQGPQGRQGPDGPPGPRSTEGPQGPDGPPEPEPSFSDKQWLEWELGPPFEEGCFTYRKPRAAPRTPKARVTWSGEAARRALTRLLTAKVDRRPLESIAYQLPPRMRRHVKARDVTCTFPGCHLLAQKCESDHVVAWPAGKSEPHNLSSECIHHHQAKHAVFTVTRLANGGLRWTLGTGYFVDRLPRPFLRGW